MSALHFSVFNLLIMTFNYYDVEPGQKDLVEHCVSLVICNFHSCYTVGNSTETCFHVLHTLKFSQNSMIGNISFHTYLLQ